MPGQTCSSGDSHVVAAEQISGGEAGAASSQSRTHPVRDNRDVLRRARHRAEVRRWANLAELLRARQQRRPPPRRAQHFCACLVRVLADVARGPVSAFVGRQRGLSPAPATGSALVSVQPYAHAYRYAVEPAPREVVCKFCTQQVAT